MSSELIQEHPQLLAIVAALLNGVSLQEICQEFGLEPAALKRYAAEAGLGRGPDPEPELPQPEPEEAAEPEDVGDRELVHERQFLEEGSRRRGEPAGHRPDPAAHPYQDESRAALHQELERIKGERQSYESQPMPHLTLCSDPDFHIGFQPESRLRALITRKQLDKAERIRQWYGADAFRWGQTPPDDL
jgi:transposase-like protein